MGCIEIGLAVYTNYSWYNNAHLSYIEMASSKFSSELHCFPGVLLAVVRFSRKVSAVSQNCNSGSAASASMN